MSKEKLTPQERYALKNVKQYKFNCVKNTEKDIIDKMESVENKSGYIKRLIRKDISESEQNKETKKEE